MKKKVTAAQWEAAIRKARGYVSSFDKTRFIIAGLALEVCDLHHGGRKGSSVYSISRFAEEIEIDRKTLYEWMRVKRLVVDKLAKGQQDKIQKIAYQDLNEVSRVVVDDTAPKEVRRRLYEQLQIDPGAKKFSKYGKHLNSILHNLQRPILLKEVPTASIEFVIEKATVIVALGKKELELREKFSGMAQDAKRLNMKSEVARRVARAD